MADHENVYADVSCHDLSEESVRGRQRQMLHWLADTGHPVKKRTMFATDWYMQAMNRDHEDFLETYQADWKTCFGEDAVEGFMSGNALCFLGFDDPSNKNAVRLRDRYQAVDVPAPAWLAV